MLITTVQRCCWVILVPSFLLSLSISVRVCWQCLRLSISLCVCWIASCVRVLASLSLSRFLIEQQHSSTINCKWKVQRTVCRHIVHTRKVGGQQWEQRKRRERKRGSMTRHDRAREAAAAAARQTPMKETKAAHFWFLPSPRQQQQQPDRQKMSEKCRQKNSKLSFAYDIQQQQQQAFNIITNTITTIIRH